MTLFYWYLLDLNNFVEFSYLEKTRIYFIPIVYHLFLNCCKNILIQVTNCFKLIVRTLFYIYTKKKLKNQITISFQSYNMFDNTLWTQLRLFYKNKTNYMIYIYLSSMYNCSREKCEYRKVYKMHVLCMDRKSIVLCFV